MQLKLVLLALAITAIYTQPNEFDACTTGGNQAGVQGYDITLNNGSVDIGTTLSCKEYDTSACQAELGDLSADSAQSTATNASSIVSYCNIDGSDLKVNVAFYDWQPEESCQYFYAFREGVSSTTALIDYYDSWVSQTTTNVLTVNPVTGDVTDHPDGIADKTGTQIWTQDYAISSIIDGSTVFADDGSDANNYVFKAQFAFSVYSNANEQHVYAFDVTLTINRTTNATENLTVTKTLVSGQCCENSLGVESLLRFCEDGDAFCATNDEINTITRNTDFYVQFELDTSDADTAVLAESYNLYPDTIQIGPFFPAWSLASGAWFDQNTPAAFVGAAIKIKSNVAFAASVTVAGRLWDKSNLLPHTCFYTGTAYEDNGSACTANDPNARRFLQASKSGDADTQVSVSKAMVFTDDENQNNNNNSKKSDDDNDNTVLIAVVVSLVVVLAIGGIVGGIYFCKSKNQKQEQGNYTEQAKNIQQQQQA